MIIDNDDIAIRIRNRTGIHEYFYDKLDDGSIEIYALDKTFESLYLAILFIKKLHAEED